MYDDCVHVKVISDMCILITIKNTVWPNYLRNSRTSGGRSHNLTFHSSFFSPCGNINMFNLLMAADWSGAKHHYRIEFLPFFTLQILWFHLCGEKNFEVLNRKEKLLSEGPADNSRLRIYPAGTQPISFTAISLMSHHHYVLFIQTSACLSWLLWSKLLLYCAGRLL